MEDQFLCLLSYVADQERKKIDRNSGGIVMGKVKGNHLGKPKIELK
ncbi:hypothetical protein [Neobacillus sp. 114]